MRFRRRVSGCALNFRPLLRTLDVVLKPAERAEGDFGDDHAEDGWFF